MEKEWVITFSNGFCGCDQEEVFEGTYEEAEGWASEYLPDYAESFAHCAFGWEGEYTEEEYEDYLADCSFDIVEREEEDDD